MIPTYNNNLISSFEQKSDSTPRRVYKIDWENNRLLSQVETGTEAARQNIKVITAVEHQEHVAMPEWFGLAMKDMYGMPKSFVKANLERLIKEALSTYLLIDRAYDFHIYDIDKHSIGIDCTISLKDGSEFKETIKVTIDV